MNKTSPIAAGPKGISKFHDTDVLIKRAGLPDLFTPPCRYHWENEAEFNPDEVQLVDNDPHGEVWVDLSPDSWDKLNPIRWTETAGTREIPLAVVEFTLAYKNDFEEIESAYRAEIETFTETAKYVEGVGTVYVCEATYNIYGRWTTKETS